MRRVVLLSTIGVFSMAVIGAAAGNTMSLSLDASTLTVSEASSGVLAYSYGEVPRKPYVKEWFSPGNVNLLRDAPHDHLHHHGLMFAIIADGVNFWEEIPVSGCQRHQSFTGMGVDEKGVFFSERLAWQGPESPDILLLEDRTIIHHHRGDTGMQMLTWTSRLILPEGRSEVKLSGNIYHGLGMRFPESMDKTGHFLFSQDKSGAFKDGPHDLAQAAWCAYTVERPGAPVTVAMFGAPQNFRATLWFTMLEPFSYLSATPDLQREPFVLRDGASLALTYGLASWDHVVGEQDIQQAYELWLKTLENQALTKDGGKKS